MGVPGDVGRFQIFFSDSGRKVGEALGSGRFIVSKSWVAVNTAEVVELVAEFNRQHDPSAQPGPAGQPAFVPLRTWDFKRMYTSIPLDDLEARIREFFVLVLGANNAQGCWIPLSSDSHPDGVGVVWMHAGDQRLVGATPRRARQMRIDGDCPRDLIPVDRRALRIFQFCGPLHLLSGW